MNIELGSAMETREHSGGALLQCTGLMRRMAEASAQTPVEPA